MAKLKNITCVIILPLSTIDNLLITLAVAAGYSVEPVISLGYAKNLQKGRKNYGK